MELEKILGLKHVFCSCVAIAVLICTILGCRNEIAGFELSDVSGEAEVYGLNIDSFDELVCAGEELLSCSEPFLYRQIRAFRINRPTAAIALLKSLIALLSFLLSLLCVFFLLEKVEDSHRCIIKFIHRSDGAK